MNMRMKSRDKKDYILKLLESQNDKRNRGTTIKMSIYGGQ